MQSIVWNSYKMMIMNILQVGFTQTKDMGMVLLHYVLNISHLINKKSTTFVPMCNLDTFVPSISIGVSGLKVGDCSEVEAGQ